MSTVTVAEPVAESDPRPESTAAAQPSEASGKRERRKAVDVYQPSPLPETPTLTVPEGRGSKLRDIPNVNFKLGKITGRDELTEHLHNVLYRRKGAAAQRKKAVLDFSGFVFDDASRETELEARTGALGKHTLEVLHKLMDVLDVPRGTGSKSDKLAALLTFLEAPRQTRDSDLAAQAAKKRAAASKKREREAQKDAKVKKAGPTKSKGDEEASTLPIQVQGPEAVDQPEILKMSTEQLRADIEAILKEKSEEELSQLTSKQIQRLLGEKYGFEVRPRKAEITSIAQSYALSRLDGADGQE
uniref:DEK-C domain-containing protein n=1 Tax=Auxenochlorella protothecoides TaxID=3075 RepID=A0A1D2AEB6_AUXPR